MLADSFHHKVEQVIKKKKGVEDFQDLVNASFALDFKIFLLVPYGVSQGKYASEKPKLENVEVMMFKRGSNKIFWKTKHTKEQFHEAQFLNKKKNQTFRK